MKYQFELTLVMRSEAESEQGFRWDTLQIEKVLDTNLTGLLAQFQLVLANIHRRLLNDLKNEMRVIDDDVPF